MITFGEPVPLPRPADPSLDPEATYLIVGGLGGFGAATARHLAAHGARHLTLISRRGPSTDEARTLLDELRGLDTTVLALAADATDPQAMREVFARIDSCGRRLAGVVHSAMVLDDAPLTELTDERVRTVLAPKTTAAAPGCPGSPCSGAPSVTPDTCTAPAGPTKCAASALAG